MDTLNITMTQEVQNLCYSFLLLIVSFILFLGITILLIKSKIRENYHGS